MIVAGGGPAGAAASCLLALAGRRVTLIERDAGPRDKICGEFLSHEASRTLAPLDIDPARLGASVIERVRLVGRGGTAEAALGFTANGLSRRRLDEALLLRAVECGVTLHRGVAVGQVRAEPSGLLAVRTATGERRCATLLLATGKHDLRGIRRRLRRPPAELVGFKTYFDLTPPQRAAVEGHVEVILLRGGYAGLQLVEGGRANLCLLVPRDRVPASGWDGLLRELVDESAHLGRRLDGAKALLERPVSIFRVPYGFVHRAAAGDPAGLFRLGDQMAVIPSFCGDGMAMALHTAAAAAAHVRGGRGADTFHRRMARDLGGQVRLASLAQRLGGFAAGQAAMLAVARHWPGALAMMAAHTRVLRQATS